jgi:hypothetical protein
MAKVGCGFDDDLEANAKQKEFVIKWTRLKDLVPYKSHYCLTPAIMKSQNWIIEIFVQNLIPAPRAQT